MFLLGASSWRISEITHDRVFVTPAPGQGGRMPFWHGDSAGRPPEFGRAIGALTRQVVALPPAHAVALLMGDYHLDEEAAHTLILYLKEQERAGALPDDRTLVVETYRDENNEWRMCLLSPFGTRVHAPLAMAVAARIFDLTGKEADLLWMDDGVVVRLPETDKPPDPNLFFPDPEEAEELIVRQLGVGGGGARAVNQGAPVNALFASRFREAAARALLLPRRAPGRRSPLWQQRKRAADLLRVTADYGSFPIVLEAFREILQDDFDLPALVTLLHEVRCKEIRVIHVTNPAPSPFAAALFFHYIANFMYEGDAPVAERRAQALQVDPVQLRALLGTTELRALLNPNSIAEWERTLQHLAPERAARHADGLHDMLLDLGDLTEAEIRARSAHPESARAWIDLLVPRAGSRSRHRGRNAVRGPGGRQSVPRRHRPDRAGKRACRPARAGPRCRGRSRGSVRADSRPVHRRRGRQPLRNGHRPDPDLPPRDGRARQSGRRRLPAGGRGDGVVRRRSAARDPPDVAPAPSPRSRAGRGKRPCAPLVDWQGVGVERSRDIVQIIEQI